MPSLVWCSRDQIEADTLSTRIVLIGSRFAGTAAASVVEGTSLFLFLATIRSGEEVVRMVLARGVPPRSGREQARAQQPEAEDHEQAEDEPVVRGTGVAVHVLR